jgi:hypothetical protein
MHYRNTIRIASLLAFSALQALYAQLDTGAISGIVKDSSGAVLQSAKVTIIETETGITISLLSNGDGFYSAPALHIGKYKISASASGFTTETQAGIDLRVQDRLNLDFTLAPGQTSTVVTVEGGAALLQTEDTSMGQVVDDATMQNLPLNGRNYIQLATLGAGTSPSRRGAERDTFIANGARELQNTYLLDGVDNKNKIVGFDSSAAQAIEPVIDGVQEFKVETSTFSAEYGQAAGAVVNVTLKSGTNQFHGSMWEYIRNSFFDAKPYFQVLGQKPDYNLNQFGATFGGPVIKDRTFFFGSWQSLRAVDDVPQLATVPTLAQRYTIPTRPRRIPTDRDTCARLSPTTRFPPAPGTPYRPSCCRCIRCRTLRARATSSPTRKSGWQTTNTTSGWITGSTTKTPSSRAIRGPRARTFCPRRCRRRRAIPAMCGRMRARWRAARHTSSAPT